jgi:hypothetical protein
LGNEYYNHIFKCKKRKEIKKRLTKGIETFVEDYKEFVKSMQAQFISKNGKAFLSENRENDRLYVPVVIATERSKGMGTKLIKELENHAKVKGFKEIVFPTILDVRLLKILIKGNYKKRMEYSDKFDENVDCWFKELL